jgi:cobalt-zinc-cadmium efflux system membrane fusion protein
MKTNRTVAPESKEIETKPDGQSEAEVKANELESTHAARKKKLIIVGTIALVTLLALLMGAWRWSRSGVTKPSDQKAKMEEEKHASEEGKEVRLSPAVLEAAKIEIETVTRRPAVALLKVTGTVENNPQHTQQVTPLVSGRVERVNVALGDRVIAGTILAVITSPEVAEMHGKLREAMTRLDSAEKNFARVQRAENRYAILQAKAKLDETDATLKRTKRLIELGAGAGKDLIAAETAHKQAQAEYEFQSTISLNREVQEAQAEVNTSRAEVTHLQQSLRALGVTETEGARERHLENISLVEVRAPAAGIVTERMVNPGAGIEASKPLFTISNVSTVWVIANVPESQLGNIHEGTPAEIHSVVIGSTAISGRVAYIDPQLSEETRTGRVRIELPNPGERLKAGMFVEVGFHASTNASGDDELVIPSTAVQRIGERTIVFIPKEGEPGVFEVREVELGGEVSGYHRVLSGLKLGEKVVTKGSFTLKTQLQKGGLGEE